MRNGILISLYSLALAAGVVCAQDPQPDNKDKPAITITPAPAEKEKATTVTPAPNQTPPGMIAPQIGSGDWGNGSGGCGCGAGGCCPAGSNWFEGTGCGNSNCGPHVWATAEWMFWSFSDQPIPGALVTTSSAPGTAQSGALGQAATKILYGNSNLDYGTFQGARLTVGGWLDADQHIGAEVSGFATEQRSTHFAAASNGTGSPSLYVPAFNTALNREDSLIVSDPVSQFAGSVLWASESRLWGFEINGVLAACSGCDYHVELLAGFRYLDLSESLLLANSTEDLTNSAVTSLVDQFTTRNQFYGGQIGTKAGYRWNFLTLDVIGKMALGENHNTESVGGSTTQTGANAPTPGTFPGGFFSQPTNIGSQRHDDFCVVPEITLKLGCEIIPGVNAFVGYDFLYMSQVNRPGSEVNRNLNLSQSQFFGTGTLSGAANPLPLNNKTDFIANAFMLGLEVHY